MNYVCRLIASAINSQILLMHSTFTLVLARVLLIAYLAAGLGRDWHFPGGYGGNDGRRLRGKNDCKTLSSVGYIRRKGLLRVFEGKRRIRVEESRTRRGNASSFRFILVIRHKIYVVRYTPNSQL
jgi:hypothetical protein